MQTQCGARIKKGDIEVIERYKRELLSLSYP